jgi:hypothetical protein
VLARPEDRLSPTLRTERESRAGPASDFELQVVEALRLETGPVYRLGSRLLSDRAALTAALESLDRSSGVFVKVHDDVRVGFAVAAVQVARDLGFEKVTYVPATPP